MPAATFTAKPGMLTSLQTSLTGAVQRQHPIDIQYYYLVSFKLMKVRHRKTLELIFFRPVPAGIKWADIIALLTELGAEVTQREGSRVAIHLFGQVRVMHRPHPSPDTDKGAVASIRKWLEENGVQP